MKVGNKRADKADKQIGQLIKLARLRAKLTQKQIGRAIGVTNQQVQRFEDGNSRITAGRLLILAQSLGVNPGTLFLSAKRNGRHSVVDDEILGMLADVQGQRAITAFSKIKSQRMKDAVLAILEQAARL